MNKRLEQSVLLGAAGLLFTTIFTNGFSAPQTKHYVPTLKVNAVLNFLGVDGIDDPTVTVMWNGQTLSKTISVWQTLKQQVNIIYDDPVITLSYQFRPPDDMIRGQLLKTSATVCVDSPSLYSPICVSQAIRKVYDPNQIVVRMSYAALKPEPRVPIEDPTPQ